MADGQENVSLVEIATAFLRLGTIGFGGPAAHIALMEEEFVRRRGWLTQQEFLDRLGAANLIPGPSSTEVAIFIGYSKRGWKGLIVAGCCFILPAAILVGVIAAAYVRYGSLPQVEGILYGVKPVVIAIVVHAFSKIGQSAVKTFFLGVIGIASVILLFLGLDNLLVLACAGVVAGMPAIFRKIRLSRAHATFVPVKFLAGLFVVAGNAVAAPFSLWRLFFTFLKIGSLLFGSGYVLLAFLRSDFVTRLHWLTEKQLLDAVAIGQVTPGPVFTTATFIGYLLGGFRGAVVATVAIFLPGFFLVAASGPLLPKVRQSVVASAVLDGVIVASLALMGVAAWHLGRAALVDPLTIVVACLSAILLFTTRVNPAWLVLGAAIVGLVRSL